MADTLVFYYIGDDEAYYKGLEAEFKKMTRASIEFRREFAEAETSIQSLVIEISKNSPACVFIDLSKLTQEYLHLARLLVRAKTQQKTLFVGLLDLLTPHEIAMESLVAGMHLSHFKSPEIFDVVYDVTKLLAPEQVGEHGFATAAFKETWKAGVFCKIGYVHAAGLHFETDFELNPGQILELNHGWLQKKTIPSKQIVVEKVTQANLYYHLKNAVDAEFKFVDELVKDEAATAEDNQDREEDRKELIRRHKKLFANWLQEQDSQEKIAKVLIVDREFHFFQNQKRVDKLPYHIRCVPYMVDVSRELVAICPQVIAVAMDDEGVSDAKNNFAFLESLISSIKKDLTQVDQPFIVVFNTAIPSNALAVQLGYQKLMSASNELSVEVLLRMAAVFDKKLHEAKLMSKNTKELQVFLKKSNKITVADFDIMIDVLKLSETDMVFTSPFNLPEGTNLRLRTPVPMVIQVQPLKAQGKLPEYIGYIHCLSESDKKELRRYVNSIFFRDHDAQVLGELTEFKKLNEAKQVEKVAQLKKAEEEKKKKEEAEAKKKAQDEENKKAKEQASVVAPADDAQNTPVNQPDPNAKTGS